MENSIDLDWMAGLFEGEGSIHIEKKHKRSRKGAPCVAYTLTVSVGMTDLELIDLFQKGFGGGNARHTTDQPGKQDSRMWRLTSAAAGSWLEKMLPYFRTARVKTKAELAIGFQQQKKVGNVGAISGYAARQEEFYDQMKVLNGRGVDAVSFEPVGEYREEGFDAWTAGLFEAEGSTHITAVNRKTAKGTPCVSYRLSAAVGMTDYEAIGLLVDHYGGRDTSRPAANERSREFRQWGLTSAAAGGWLERIYPHLQGSRIREKVDLGIRFQKQKTDGAGSIAADYSVLQADLYQRMKTLNHRGERANSKK